LRLSIFSFVKKHFNLRLPCWWWAWAWCAATCAASTTTWCECYCIVGHASWTNLICELKHRMDPLSHIFIWNTLYKGYIKPCKACETASHHHADT